MKGERVAPVDRIGPWRLERAATVGATTGDGSRWVPIGTRSSGVLAMVDPAGLVGPAGCGWSLDWWVGAEDRWYLPARETAVRQSLVEQSPVVETRQRVPGGDVVQHAYAAQGPAALGGREVIVVRLTNETPVPVAVAVSLRPYGVEADGALRRLAARDERAVDIDGDWTLVIDREARRVAGSVDGDDPLSRVVSGAATAEWPAVEDERGDASVALVFPLPHSVSMQVLLVPGEVAGDPVAFDGVAAPGAVAAGWARQADHGLRPVLPDEQLAQAFTAARRRLLLGAPDLVGAPVRADQALVVRALAQLGHGDELRPVVGDLLEHQTLSGSLPDVAGSEAATGAALAAIGWWWRHDPRLELLDELIGPVAAAARRLDRRRVGGRRAEPSHDGLLPPGPQPFELGGSGVAYLDDWWAAAGLFEGADVLAAARQSSAEDLALLGEQFLGAVRRSVGVVAGEGVATVPVGPDRPVDGPVIGILPALGPLGVVDAGDGAIARTLDHLRSHHTDDSGAVASRVQGATAPWLTGCLALYEIANGDARGLDRLDQMVRAGGPTASWPASLDEHGLGRGGRGDDPVATALFALLVRALLVSERRPTGEGHDGGLDVLPVVPRSWLGQGVELHGAPTTLGRFGFAVRWHGERPALLWELEPAAGVEAPTIRCPGLAPGWATTDLRGETLLPPPPVEDRRGAGAADRGGAGAADHGGRP